MVARARKNVMKVYGTEYCSIIEARRCVLYFQHATTCFPAKPIDADAPGLMPHFLLVPHTATCPPWPPHPQNHQGSMQPLGPRQQAHTGASCRPAPKLPQAGATHCGGPHSWGPLGVGASPCWDPLSPGIYLPGATVPALVGRLAKQGRGAPSPASTCLQGDSRPGGWWHTKQWQGALHQRYLGGWDGIGGWHQLQSPPPWVAVCPTLAKPAHSGGCSQPCGARAAGGQLVGHYIPVSHGACTHW